MVIQVFEHEILSIGQRGFTIDHWRAFGDYLQKQKVPYATILTNGVRFREFVGVIQIGNCTIEILPKIDRNDHDKGKWQTILLRMLEECRWMQEIAHQKADLRIKQNSILETYLTLFLLQCEAILREGLVKRYRVEQKNQFVLRGKLIFRKHLKYNAVHRERFFTEHTVYDKDNIHNRIIVKALTLVKILVQRNSLKDQTNKLLAGFPELSDIPVNHQVFQTLTYDRKTFHYKEAMEIASMLLLNYRPDIRGGKNHVLAIVFDMNELWEEFVFRRVHRVMPERWVITRQNRKRFWEQDVGTYYKLIRPDIVVTNENQQVIIMDTKWKIPSNNTPSDDDLKQMFVYNEFWLSCDAILVYPDQRFLSEPEFQSGTFAKKNLNASVHLCTVLKISVLDKFENKLDPDFGSRIIDFVRKRYWSSAKSLNLV